jgi:hypothetical protein
MHLTRCISIPNLSQTKRVSVKSNLQSTTNKEFELDEEAWLISEKKDNPTHSELLDSARHLISHLDRSKPGYNTRNPEENEMKSDCPLAELTARNLCHNTREKLDFGSFGSWVMLNASPKILAPFHFAQTWVYSPDGVLCHLTTCMLR